MPRRSSVGGGPALGSRGLLREHHPIALLLVTLVLEAVEAATMMSALCRSARGSEGSGPANRCQVTGCAVMPLRDDSVAVLPKQRLVEHSHGRAYKTWLCV